MKSIDEQNEAQQVTDARKTFPKWRWLGVWSRRERRLRLLEVVTMKGLGPGYGAPENYSGAFTVGIEWKVQDLWIGAFWKGECDDRILWICLIPCLPIRLHWKRSYGGWFASPGFEPTIPREHRRRWWQLIRAV